MRRYLFVMLSLLTITAHGQAIYKCTQKDGTTAFQDSPCPGAPNAPPMSAANPGATMPAAHSYGSTPSLRPLPSQPQSTPQPPSGGLSPLQREQLKQQLEALTQLSTKSAATPASPGVSPDAHQVPWALVFITNADGSFSPRGPIRYNGVSYSGPDAKFTHQALFAGVDLTSVQGRGVWAHFEGRTLVIDKFQ